MDAIVLASDPAPLSVKLIVACLAGLLPAILSGRVRTDGKLLAAFYLTACAAAVVALHWTEVLDPGVIAAFVGLVVGLVVFLIAPSRRSSVFAATTMTLAALTILAITVFVRMPPSRMRSAIAHIRCRGGIVQQSDNPGTTYRDQWSVRFRHAGVNDIQLLGLASDLRTLPELWLTLSNSPITDRGLAALTDADNLVWLELDGTKVTNTGLVHLGRLTKLRDLRLCRTRISDLGLVHLRGLHELQTLLLADTAVSDAGLENLQGLTQLRYLDLSTTQVTDAGLERLRGLTQLQFLRLKDTQVTDADVDELKKVLPNVEIRR